MRKIIFILLLLLVSMPLILISCNSNRVVKELSGFYVAFTDLKPIMANTINDKDKVKKMFDYSTPFYMNGYNFTFLYIKEDGSFYHHFSDKNILIQETIGRIFVQNNNDITLKGETRVIEKDNTTTQPFKATLEIKDRDNNDKKSLFLTYLDLDKPKKRIYASTGYDKINSVNDLMYLTFHSIKNYNKNIADDNIMKRFPEVKNLFAKAEQNIKKWKSIDIEQGFYVPKEDSDESFIYVDKTRNNFIYYHNDNPIHSGVYIFEGNYSLEGKNLIIINIYKDFLPFSIIPNEDITKVIGYENIEGVEYLKYEGDDYLKTLSEGVLENIKTQPFYSATLVELISNISNEE